VRLRFGGALEATPFGAPLALELRELRVDLAAGGARLYRHTDWRGNVKFVTDDAGRVVAHYRYHPYGVESVLGSDADSARRFAQGRALAGLVLLGHRLYDPEAERFLAPDPIYQLLDQYAYAQGNPILFWDPSGASAVGTGFGVAVYVGMTLGGLAAATLPGGLVWGPLLGAAVFGGAYNLVLEAIDPAGPRFTAGDLLDAMDTRVEPSGGGGDGSGAGGEGGPSSGGGGGGGGGSGGTKAGASASIQIKTLELSVGDISFGGSFGGAGGGGCYAPLGRAAVPDLRAGLAVLLPLVALLACRVAWETRRARRSAARPVGAEAAGGGGNADPANGRKP
jgi:RHS repeat-associated protein